MSATEKEKSLVSDLCGNCNGRGKMPWFDGFEQKTQWSICRVCNGSGSKVAGTISPLVGAEGEVRILLEKYGLSGVMKAFSNYFGGDN